MSHPININAPSIIGSTKVGDTVDAFYGDWSDGTQVAGTGFYELADDADGTNAAGPVDAFPVELFSSWEGMFIRVNGVQFENGDGTSDPVHSEWHGPIRVVTQYHIEGNIEVSEIN